MIWVIEIITWKSPWKKSWRTVAWLPLIFARAYPNSRAKKIRASISPLARASKILEGTTLRSKEKIPPPAEAFFCISARELEEVSTEARSACEDPGCKRLTRRRATRIAERFVST
jgi:hypothetical protein